MDETHQLCRKGSLVEVRAEMGIFGIHAGYCLCFNVILFQGKAYSVWKASFHCALPTLVNVMSIISCETNFTVSKVQGLLSYLFSYVLSIRFGSGQKFAAGLYPVDNWFHTGFMLFEKLPGLRSLAFLYFARPFSGCAFLESHVLERIFPAEERNVSFPTGDARYRF